MILRQPLIPYFGQYQQRFADSSKQVSTILPTWMTGICGSSRSACCKHMLSSQLQPDQSIWSFTLPKVSFWRASCQDPIPAELQDKVRLTLFCLGSHLQIDGDIEPSPVILGEQASMEKTTQRFQRIASTFADLNAEGFNAQSVNDLLTVYVGTASQHVLRMSFCARIRSSQLRQAGHDFLVPPHSARRHLSIIFFCPSNLEDLMWALQFPRGPTPRP